MEEMFAIDEFETLNVKKNKGENFGIRMGSNRLPWMGLNVRKMKCENFGINVDLIYTLF